MPFFRRHEGSQVRSAPTLRRMMPFLMPTRNESVVYFEQHIEVDAALAFAERLGARHPGRKVTFFQVFLYAMARTLAARPQLNRFVVGQRLYQRHAVELSFAVKKQMSDTGGLTTVKVAIDPLQPIEAMLALIETRIGEGRGEKKLRSETEMDIVTLLPRFALRFVMAAQRWLDHWNLLPKSLIDGDPLYASIFLANLGSVGLDSAYHHLFEYGTTPIFATLGRVKKDVVVGDDGAPAVRDRISVKYSLDERIADGFYCARSLELLKEMLERPELLEQPIESR